MRRFVALFAGLVVLLGGAGLAQATVDLQVTFTGDNVVAAFWRDGGTPSQIFGYANRKMTEWWVPETRTVSGLDYGHTYEIFFRVWNDGPYGSDGNPAAFLAEIKSGATGQVLTSGIPSPSVDRWQFALDPSHDPITYPDEAPPTSGWQDATEWAYQGTSSLNGGNNIWRSAPGGPIAGISTSAHWIWGDKNGTQLGPPETPDPENWLWLKATITTPVPEPASLIVWSVLGIGGAVGAMRRRRARGSTRTAPRSAR